MGLYPALDVPLQIRDVLVALRPPEGPAVEPAQHLLVVRALNQLRGRERPAVLMELGVVPLAAGYPINESVVTVAHGGHIAPPASRPLGFDGQEVVDSSPWRWLRPGGAAPA